MKSHRRCDLLVPLLDRAFTNKYTYVCIAMNRIPKTLQDEIRLLRKGGKSILEIVQLTGAAKTTVQRYVKEVQIPPEYAARLREKQGGSKSRAQGLRANLKIQVKDWIGAFTDRDLTMIMIGLYWGEGTKRDFSVINSDVHLLQTLLWSIYKLGVSKERVSISLRVHKEISISDAKTYWAGVLHIPERVISRVEVIPGKKKGKLQYGMCRIRVRRGLRERLWVQEVIRQIGNKAQEKVVSQ